MNLAPNLISSTMNPQQIINQTNPQPSFLNGTFNMNNTNVQLPPYSNLGLQLTPQWSHVPETNISWGSANTSDLVRFTAVPNNNVLLPTHNYFRGFMSPKISVKRKSFSDNDIQEPIPNKILITEEKMAAKMQGMHISSDTVFSSDTGKNDFDDDIGNINSTNENVHARGGPQLFLCNELQNLGKPECVVPRNFFKVETPSRALVLWKPKNQFNTTESLHDDGSDSPSSVTITEITDTFDTCLDTYKDHRDPIALPYIGFADNNNSDAMEM